VELSGACAVLAVAPDENREVRMSADTTSIRVFMGDISY
jgi:hypothetical protein